VGIGVLIDSARMSNSFDLKLLPLTCWSVVRCKTDECKTTRPLVGIGVLIDGARMSNSFDLKLLPLRVGQWCDARQMSVKQRGLWWILAC
jgi:hypothetical protein